MSRKSNIAKMKTFIKTSIVLSLFFLLTSFSWTNDNFKKTYDSSIISSTIVDSVDEVIITYEKPDVCNLNYLGEIKVKEKFLFYHKNGLKKNTLAELKKQASEKDGNIVYVYTDMSDDGFAIGFTRIVCACVFKK